MLEGRPIRAQGSAAPWSQKLSKWQGTGSCLSTCSNCFMILSLHITALVASLLMPSVITLAYIHLLHILQTHACHAMHFCLVCSLKHIIGTAVILACPFGHHGSYCHVTCFFSLRLVFFPPVIRWLLSVVGGDVDGVWFTGRLHLICTWFPSCEANTIRSVI